MHVGGEAMPMKADGTMQRASREGYLAADTARQEERPLSRVEDVTEPSSRDRTQKGVGEHGQGWGRSRNSGEWRIGEGGWGDMRGREPV
jgi:hypothetical protein